EPLRPERGETHEAALEWRASEVDLTPAVGTAIRHGRHGTAPNRSRLLLVGERGAADQLAEGGRSARVLNCGPHEPDVGALLELARRNAEGRLGGPADEHALAVPEHLDVVVGAALRGLPGQERRRRAHAAPGE